jgi:hypothetical protein
MVHKKGPNVIQDTALLMDQQWLTGRPRVAMVAT